MLYQVIGATGSGKTSYLYDRLREVYSAHGECVWISPEQQSVQTEREILALLGDECNLSVEILNFERLPERIARSYGGLCVNYPDGGALCALLSVLVYEKRRELSHYAAFFEDNDFLEGLNALFAKLRSECISPCDLKNALASGKIEDKQTVSKLSDIALLYEAYDAYFDETQKDPRNALTVLASELAEKPFFVGKTVFIDGYYTFTAQEHAVIAEIEKQADAVYCSFTYDGREQFSVHEQSAFRMRKYVTCAKEVFVGPYRRSAVPELVHLERHLWSDETPVYTEKTEHIRIVKASNPFTEAEAVAREILRLVRGGLRYREITVLARHSDAYVGVLDAVLKQNGIPFFLSEKQDPLTMPLTSFVCACLDLVRTDFALYAVRAYLKSGYSGLSAEECDLLLRYATSWRVSGKAWYASGEWKKNPDGYREGGLDEEQEAFLIAVNKARNAFLETVLPLKEDIGGKDHTARSLLGALYAHLERVNAAERYTETLNRLAESGQTEQASKDSRLWENLMRSFELIDGLCGEQTFRGKEGLRRMRALLRLTVGQYALGSIPSALDQVMIGEASLCRPDNAKAVLLMGCNDGVFPAVPGRDLLFDEDELCVLETEGLSFAEPFEKQLENEKFFFYNAIASASETLIFTYPASTISGEEKRISSALTRVKELLPTLTEETYDGTGADSLFSPDNARSMLATLREHQDYASLCALLSEPVRDFPPLSEPESFIRYDKENVSFSPSSLERYRYCPFSYFDRYLLKLKEKKINRFSTPEIGTFLHKLLELFLREHTKTGRFVPPESENALEQETDELIRECVLSLTDGEDVNERFRHTVRNLKKTLLLLFSNLCNEFAESDFLPVGFEVGIGLPNGTLPAAEYALENGGSLFLRGSIDRVDTYEKDGTTFVRVVDYKSYAKSFSLQLVENELLDAQMLLYLFAYCKLSGKNTVPAGILYSAASLKFADGEQCLTAEEAQQSRESQLSRTGLILEDTSVALAMDRSMSGRFVPASFDAEGEIKHTASTLDADGFARLQNTVEGLLKETAQSLLNGDTSVRPLRIGQNYDACTHCPYLPICRRKG